MVTALRLTGYDYVTTVLLACLKTVDCKNFRQTRRFPRYPKPTVYRVEIVTLKSRNLTPWHGNCPSRFGYATLKSFRDGL